VLFVRGRRTHLRQSASRRLGRTRKRRSTSPSVVPRAARARARRRCRTDATRGAPVRPRLLRRRPSRGRGVASRHRVSRVAVAIR
jgi:hypothetical protein